MTLDRLLQDAGVHIDALIDRHLEPTAPLRDDPAAPATDWDDVLIISDRTTDDVSTGGGRRRWPMIAAAAAAVISVIAGVAIVQRQLDDSTPADGPPTTLTSAGSVRDLHLDNLVFDGRWLWSTRRGSTFLDQRDPTTGEVVRSFNLPAARSDGIPLVHDGLLYVPTWKGVVEVDVTTGSMSGSLAESDAGEVWSIAVTDDGVWLCRGQNSCQTLERWALDLTTLEMTVEPDVEFAYSIVASCRSVYLATHDRGLQRYDADGRLAATVPGVGLAFEMATGDDGTVWVPEAQSGDLIGVDPRTDTVSVRVPVAEGALSSVEVTADQVWVTGYDDHLLAVVDRATAAVAASTWLPKPPESVAHLGDAAWVAGDGGWALRFSPTR